VPSQYKEQYNDSAWWDDEHYNDSARWDEQYDEQYNDFDAVGWAGRQLMKGARLRKSPLHRSRISSRGVPQRWLP